MAMKLLLVRPPRYLWPFNSQTSAFWQPLAFCCLAGQVRRELPEVEVGIVDCPALRMGWRSLAGLLADRRPDVVGIGEEVVSAGEGLRLAGLVKRLLPECRVVAGGYYYSYMPAASFGITRRVCWRR